MPLVEDSSWSMQPLIHLRREHAISLLWLEQTRNASLLSHQLSGRFQESSLLRLTRHGHTELRLAISAESE